MNAEPNSQKRFELGEIYNYLRKSFERLEIDGLQVEENLFVDGQAIREDPLFLPNPLKTPKTQIDSEYMSFFKSKPTKAVRYYLTIRVLDWSGEVVISMFIRVYKNKSKMFVENSIFLLPPLKRNYYAVENISLHAPVRKIFRLAAKSLFASPFLVIFSPLVLLREVLEVCNRFGAVRRQRREVLENLSFNYGALQSVREIGMEDTWRVYFQKLDYQMNSKIIQQQF